MVLVTSCSGSSVEVYVAARSSSYRFHDALEIEIRHEPRIRRIPVNDVFGLQAGAKEAVGQLVRGLHQRLQHLECGQHACCALPQTTRESVDAYAHGGEVADGVERERVAVHVVGEQVPQDVQRALRGDGSQLLVAQHLRQRLVDRQRVAAVAEEVPADGGTTLLHELRGGRARRLDAACLALRVRGDPRVDALVVPREQHEEELEAHGVLRVMGERGGTSPSWRSRSSGQ